MTERENLIDLELCHAANELVYGSFDEQDNPIELVDYLYNSAIKEKIKSQVIQKFISQLIINSDKYILSLKNDNISCDLKDFYKWYMSYLKDKMDYYKNLDYLDEGYKEIINYLENRENEQKK